ncbi:hypothetical protein GX441_08850 [bacterium]|nr:hypothetical protein [bacterium]
MDGTVSGEKMGAYDRGEFYPKVRNWIIQKFGEERYLEFSETLPREIAERLEDADQAAWYPVEDSKLLYEKMFAHFGEEHLEDYVHFYVNQAIKGFLRGLVSFLKPLDLAKRALSLWKRFHSTGRFDTAVHNPTHGTITLYDWAYSPVHCKIHGLWFRELVSMAGGKDIEVTETHCVHKGDPFCRWEVHFA